MLETSQTLKLFPDYHNLNIQAKENRTNDVVFEGDPSHVSLSLDHKIVVFHPISDMHEVPVEIEFRKDPPSDGLKPWDHVVEATLRVGAKGIIISNGFPETSEHKVPAPSGKYRVRIYFGGLSEEGIDADDGEDYYKVVVFPVDPKDTKKRRSREVLKQWSGFLPPPVPDRIFDGKVWGLTEVPKKSGRFVVTFVNEDGSPRAYSAIIDKKKPDFARFHATFDESLKTGRLVMVATIGNSQDVRNVEYINETKMISNTLKLKISGS